MCLSSPIHIWSEYVMGDWLTALVLTHSTWIAPCYSQIILSSSDNGSCAVLLYNGNIEDSNTQNPLSLLRILLGPLGTLYWLSIHCSGPPVPARLRYMRLSDWEETSPSLVHLAFYKVKLSVLSSSILFPYFSKKAREEINRESRCRKCDSACLLCNLS